MWGFRDLVGTYIYFGPKNSGSVLEQLRLPEFATKTVEYKNLGLTVDYSIKFTGTRLVVVSLNAHSDSGVMTQDLVKLQIPKLLREFVYKHNPELHSLIRDKALDKNSLGQLYWSEYVFGGAPRELIMSQLGIARTTANYHLKKLETLGIVPKDRSLSYK